MYYIVIVRDEQVCYVGSGSDREEVVSRVMEEYRVGSQIVGSSDPQVQVVEVPSTRCVFVE